MEKLMINTNIANEKSGILDSVIIMSKIMISMVGVFAINGYVVSHALETILMIK